MAEGFDYKNIAKGAGKLVKGVVKVVSPEAGPGVDEAGGGLGDILAAAGVSLDDDPADKAPEKTPAKSHAKAFDSFDMRAPKPENTPPPPRQSEPSQERREGPPPTGQSDRQRVEALLLSRRWSQTEVDRILAGPPGPEKAAEAASDGQVVKPVPAQRVATVDGSTESFTGVSDPVDARRVIGVAGRRVKDA